MYKHLKDEKFLQELDTVRVREKYVKIILLDFKERPIRSLEGVATQGSINVNGSSAIRRTINLTLSATEDKNNLDNIESLISMNKKIKIELGLNNPFLDYKQYGDIVWFPAGVYIITSCAIQRTTRAVNITLQGKDKMCLLDGTSGGSLPSAVVFHEIYEYDEEGNQTVSYPTIFQIIHECVRHFGGEIEQNILIQDIPNTAKKSIKYNGMNPIWFPDDYSGFIISEETPTQYPKFLDHKYIYGQDIGYEETEFTYPGELILGTGDSVVSVLDEIKKVLGNYEYYYDLEGHFVFREKRNYLNHYYTPITELNGSYYIQSFLDNKYYYSFINDPSVTTYSDRQDYENIKNDFSIWGSRKNKNGVITPIHYHLAIDEKPELDLATQYMGEIKTRGNEHLYYFFNIIDKPFESKEARDKYEADLLEKYAHLSPEQADPYVITYTDAPLLGVLEEIKKTEDYYEQEESSLNKSSASYEEDLKKLQEEKEVKMSALAEQKQMYIESLAKTRHSSEYQPFELIQEYINKSEELKKYQFDIPYVLYFRIDYNVYIHEYYKVVISRQKILKGKSSIIKTLYNEKIDTTYMTPNIKMLHDDDETLKKLIKKISDIKIEPEDNKGEGGGLDIFPNNPNKGDSSENGQKPSDPNTPVPIQSRGGFQDIIDSLKPNKPDSNNGKPDSDSENKPSEKPEEKPQVNLNDYLTNDDLYIFFLSSSHLNHDMKSHFLIDSEINLVNEKKRLMNISRENFIKNSSSLDKNDENYKKLFDSYYEIYRTDIALYTREIENIIDSSENDIDDESFKNLYDIDYTTWTKTWIPLFSKFNHTNNDSEKSLDIWLKSLEKEISALDQQKLLMEYALFLELMLEKENSLMVAEEKDKITVYKDTPPDDPTELFIYTDNCVFSLIGRPCREWREELYRRALLNQESSSEPGYYDAELLAKNVKTGIPLWRTMFDTMNSTWEEDWNLAFKNVLDEYAWDGWNPDVFQDPSTILYWLDFIDDNPVLSDYSVSKVGRRTYAETRESIHYLYTLAIPDIIFFENTGDVEEMKRLTSYYESIGQKYCAIKTIHKDYFSASSTGQTAFDYTRELIYQYLTSKITVTIACTPRYYLEPNSLIYINDVNNNIVGEYTITQYTIPLIYNGVMNITAMKALSRV